MDPQFSLFLKVSISQCMLKVATELLGNKCQNQQADYKGTVS